MTVDLSRAKSIVDQHLGTGVVHKKGEVSYYCPFCNHSKRKLQVNFETQKWHCWVCNAKGLSVNSLLRKSNAPIQAFTEIRQVYGTARVSFTKPSHEMVSLPADYKPLHIVDNTVAYRQAIHYATVVRKLTPIDILRYEIGYCEQGPYGGMLIIPSYDCNGRLNFFTARSYYREVATHKNPSISKDIIGFESQINWNEPVTIVEGAFDAIATKRNAIPLFGKLIQPALKSKITLNAKRVNIALDQDAIKSSIALIEYFLEQGIEVYYVELSGKDPSDLGYAAMQQAINTTKKIDLVGLVRLKINNPESLTFSKKSANLY